MYTLFLLLHPVCFVDHLQIAGSPCTVCSRYSQVFLETLLMKHNLRFNSDSVFFSCLVKCALVVFFTNTSLIG